MERTQFVALAVAGVVIPAFAIVAAAAALGAHVAQEVALAGIATLAIVTIAHSGGPVTRR